MIGCQKCPKKGCGAAVFYLRKANGRFVAVNPQLIEGFSWDGRPVCIQVKHQCRKITATHAGNVEAVAR